MSQHLHPPLRRSPLPQIALGLCATLAFATTPASPVTRAAPGNAITAAVERLAGPAPSHAKPTRGTARVRADVAAFYAARANQPAWHDDGGATPAGVAVLAALRTAANKGLDARDYDGLALTYRLLDLPLSGDNHAPWSGWDVSLSLAVARYAQDLHFGRVEPGALGLDLAVDPARIDLAAALESIATSSDVAAAIARMEPAFRHYRMLQAQLVRYRELAHEPALTTLPPLPKRTLEPGDPWDGAAALARLLAALGDLGDVPGSVGDGRYDAALAAAVQRFQRRHGLEADGRLGRGTFAALTLPLAARVRQIELTLERWRWLPPGIDTPPILVNIPAFRLYAFETPDDDEARMLRVNVIVGQVFKDLNTPVFTANMTHVIFNPYWDVPRSIARKELLPDIAHRPGYMEKNHFEIVGGQSDNSPVLAPTGANLAAVASGRARLRQRPGDDNALGRVKFMLPNPHNVYLHDTPAKSLFTRTRRAFSHGCIRVGDPTALAVHVLSSLPDWNRERIVAAMQGEEPLRVNLPRPIPVFVVYGTTLAANDGIYFFEDLYGHDAKLDATLRKAR